MTPRLNNWLIRAGYATRRAYFERLEGVSQSKPVSRRIMAFIASIDSYWVVR